MQNTMKVLQLQLHRTKAVVGLQRSLTFTLLLLVSLVYVSCTDEGSDPLSGREEGINTIREPFHKTDKPCGPYPSYYMKFLDDTQCRKRLPSNRDREFVCPVAASASLISSDERYIRPSLDGGQLIFDESLKEFFPKEIAVTVVLIRRVDGVPYYRYLSNGRHYDPLEMWSSSKFLGVMNASESIRYYSDGALGLDGSVKEYPIGDLISVVHSYDEKVFSSNGLMYWFHDVGGRDFANQLIHSRWLNRPDTEVFGGNYGAKAPDLGLSLRGEDGLSVDVPLGSGWFRSNKLSTFTLAEALKRLVMYREDPETHLEFSTWEDVKVLLYGAQNSIWYDHQTPQGMESDPSIYVQEAVDINAIEQSTEGAWRIFSKLGLGSSRGGELVHTDYACLPVFTESGEIAVDEGVEMVISVHYPLNDDYHGGDRELAKLYKNLIEKIQSGQIR